MRRFGTRGKKRRLTYVEDAAAAAVLACHICSFVKKPPPSTSESETVTPCAPAGTEGHTVSHGLLPPIDRGEGEGEAVVSPLLDPAAEAFET